MTLSLSKGIFPQNYPFQKGFCLTLHCAIRKRFMIDSSFYSFMREMLKQTPDTFQRYLYDRIPWESRLVGILGAKGVGKSTMILQHIKNLGIPNGHLYITAESLWFSDHTMLDFAQDFVSMGGTYLYIDEIHKYKGWSRELKLIYDLHPALHIVFTGSSVLDIKKGEADLSRRALMYTLEGLSFREYVALKQNIKIPTFTLQQILDNEVDVPQLELPLPAFHDYLRQGYYPFFMEDGYLIRLSQVVSQTMEVDIPVYFNLQVSTARKLRQLLSIVSRIAPVKPNMSNLAQELSTSKNSIPDYLGYLESAGMISLLRDDTGGLRALGKVEKVYLENTNLMYALSQGEPNIGNVRETFFYNQMRVNNEVTASKISDFSIKGKTFEVGGKKKGQKQIENAEQGYVVRDDIEYSYGNIIPLWYFGLNY